MAQPGHVRCDGRGWFVHGASRGLFCAHPSLGFDYEFNSIDDATNELFCAYKEMFELAVSQNKNPMRQLLGIYFPIINVVLVS